MNNKTKPLVSVVLSAYNHEKYVGQCIESIVNQTYGWENIELLVIDDCSPDNTGSVIKELSEKHNFLFTQNKQNRGLVKNRNLLIKQANGKYLCGCGSDDYWHPERIEKQVDFMEQNEQYQMCYGRVYLDKDGEISTYKRSYKGGKIFKELLTMEYHIPAPTYMFRKSIFDKVGLYDESLRIEDWYMNLKISKEHEIGFLDEFLSYYRIHDTNVSRNIDMIFENQWAILKKYKNSEYYRKAYSTYLLRKYYMYSGYKASVSWNLLPSVLIRYPLSKKVWKGLYRMLSGKETQMWE